MPKWFLAIYCCGKVYMYECVNVQVSISVSVGVCVCERERESMHTSMPFINLLPLSSKGTL